MDLDNSCLIYFDNSWITCWYIAHICWDQTAAFYLRLWLNIQPQICINVVGKLYYSILNNWIDFVSSRPACNNIFIFCCFFPVRFRLHFERESKSEIAHRKKQAMQPFVSLPEVGWRDMAQLIWLRGVENVVKPYKLCSM